MFIPFAPRNNFSSPVEKLFTVIVASFPCSMQKNQRRSVTGNIRIYYPASTPPPEKEYLASLRKYAESGSYIAQRTLGGELWKKGDHNCLVWYRKAADQGDDIAQFNLGLAHLDGSFGAEVNPAETLKLWLLSAAQGNAGALKDLGVFWKDGLSGKKNLPKE